MTDLRQAAQQALVALEAAEELAGKHDAQLEYGFHQTITVLKAALEQIDHRTMIYAHRATEARIREIHHGRKRPHDVEVMAL